MKSGFLSIILIGLPVGGLRAEPSKSLLPEDRDGTASAYPGDQGIEKDPSVIFIERFDSGSLDAIGKRWENVKNKKIMAISKDVPDGSADGTSLMLHHVGGQITQRSR
tara:strand:- start:75 stop:398 length:324 start_codon:yes stop_codon:yes gene_type:complete